MFNTFVKSAAVGGIAIASSMTMAGENLWVYAKGTDTRPEGSWEFKLGDIYRTDKRSGSYHFHDIRPEIEYGVTDRLTVGVEAMIFDHDYDVGPCSEEANNPPGPMCEAGDESGKFDDTQFGGYELSMKYNIYSPYKDFMGLSLGAAYERRDKYRLDGADIDQDSWVLMAFLQKDFLDDTVVTVLNIKTEFERRKSPGVLEEEIALDIAAGISYRFAPKWFVGLEFRHQSDYLNPQEFEEAGQPGYDQKGFNENLQRSSFDLSDFRIGSRHQHGNYLGPTLHYAEQRWWLTGGILWQIRGGGSEYADVRSHRNWDEHEKMHIGLYYGYEF